MNVTEQIQHNELSKAFVRAAQELGLPYTADFNGASQDGVGYYDVTQKKARRESASTAYLRPARKRHNLIVQPHALTTSGAGQTRPRPRPGIHREGQTHRRLRRP
jgi:choline dehydrogenase-like flavoprotein